MAVLQEIFDYFYLRYVNLLKENRDLKNKAKVVIGEWGSEIPTQSNKPSAHSSLSKDEAKRLWLQAGFIQPWYVISTVTNTNSMEPFIDSNSVVVSEQIRQSVLDKQPIVKGDICIYWHDRLQTHIIHRVIDTKPKEELYYFKGDNNYSGDGWVKLSDIRWRYVGQLQTLQENIED